MILVCPKSEDFLLFFLFGNHILHAIHQLRDQLQNTVNRRCGGNSNRHHTGNAVLYDQKCDRINFHTGATAAATGENAVVVGCRKAELIVGPMGIVIADSLNGEITPRMALAVAQSDARKILIPFHHCDTLVVGIADYNMARLVQEAVECAKAACRPGEPPGLDT